LEAFDQQGIPRDSQLAEQLHALGRESRKGLVNSRSMPYFAARNFCSELGNIGGQFLPGQQLQPTA